MSTRTGGGALLFTADDFEEKQEGQQQASSATGEQLKTEKPATAPPADDFDIEIEDEQQTTDRPAAQADEPRFGTGADVPEALRGKTLSEASGVFDTLKQLASINLNNQNQPREQPTQPQEQPFDFELSEDDLGVGANPAAVKQKILAAMEQFAQAKLQPFQISQLATASLMAQQQAKENLPHWDLFGEQINQIAGGLPVTQTANFNTWQAIHDRLVTSNLSKVFEKTQKQQMKPDVPQTEVPTGSTSNGNGGAPAKRTVKVTKAQADVARAMGVDVKDIIKYL